MSAAPAFLEQVRVLCWHVRGMGPKAKVIRAGRQAYLDLIGTTFVGRDAEGTFILSDGGKTRLVQDRSLARHACAAGPRGGLVAGTPPG